MGARLPSRSAVPVSSGRCRPCFPSPTPGPRPGFLAGHKAVADRPGSGRPAPRAGPPPRPLAPRSGRRVASPVSRSTRSTSSRRGWGRPTAGTAGLTRGFGHTIPPAGRDRPTRTDARTPPAPVAEVSHSRRAATRCVARQLVGSGRVGSDRGLAGRWGDLRPHGSGRRAPVTGRRRRRTGRRPPPSRPRRPPRPPRRGPDRRRRPAG